jgi:hypothetical protein
MLDRLSRRHRIVPAALTLIALFWLAALGAGGRPSQAGAATPAFQLYGDYLAPGWSSCSWDAGVDFASTAQVHSGAGAIALRTTAPGGGLCLTTSQPLDTTPYATLQFAARAAQPGSRLQVFLYDATMTPLTYVWLSGSGGDPSTSAWSVYSLPLSALGAAGRALRGFGLQPIDGAASETIYVDDVAFVPAPVQTPAPPSGPAPAVYTNGLGQGWSSCSWDASVDFASTAQVASGSRALAMTVSAGGGGLCLRAGQPLDTIPYAKLRFSARAATAGEQYQIFLYDGAMRPSYYIGLATAGGNPVTGGWQTYTVPLAAFGLSGHQLGGIGLQQIGGAIPQTLYVDEVALVPGSAAAATSSQPIALGAYVFGAPDDVTQLDGFSSAVGATPAVVMWYQDWEGAPAFDSVAMNAVAARGAVPMVTWQPWGAPHTPSGMPAWSDARIAAGAYDAYVHQWAHAAAAWGRPLYLRFAHEMNGNWYSWSAGVNGNTAADYVAAWRHVHDVFQQEGAANVRWVWSPNVFAPGDLSVLSLYPGDAYVDWVALDGYNWGTAVDGKRWQSLADVFGYSYDVLTAQFAKPFMIAETASAEIGGDKAAWISQGLLTDLPARLPAVRAVIWFDENKETDWRVNSSAAALAAYRQVAAAYRGSLP